MKNDSFQKFKLEDLHIWHTYQNPCDNKGYGGGLGNVFNKGFSGTKFIDLAKMVRKARIGRLKIYDKVVFNNFLQGNKSSRGLEYFINNPSKIYLDNDPDPIKIRIEYGKPYLREGYHRAIALHVLGKKEIKAKLTNQ